MKLKTHAVSRTCPKRRRQTCREPCVPKRNLSLGTQYMPPKLNSSMDRRKPKSLDGNVSNSGNRERFKFRLVSFKKKVCLFCWLNHANSWSFLDSRLNWEISPQDVLLGCASQWIIYVQSIYDLLIIEDPYNKSMNMCGSGDVIYIQTCYTHCK